MNSRKKCKNCEVYYPQSPEYPHYRNWCSTKCGEELALKALDKVRQKQRQAALKTAKKKKQQSAKNLRELNKNTLAWQHKHTQKAFNKMRVLEELLWFAEQGKEPECISCGKTNMDWCCGHFKTVGAHPELRYERPNTNLQCNRYCNMGLSGNINGNKTTRGYKQGLIEKYGETIGSGTVIVLEHKHATKNWTCDELEKMRKEFNARIKRLTEILNN